MNTRLWLEPCSDLCLKSSKQQSQQAIGAEIAYYVESQQATADKSCVCLARLISFLFICSWPFSYTILDLRLNTADYVWSPVFQVNIISPLEYKAHILSSELYLNRTPTHPSTLLYSVILIPLSPSLLINIFDTNACCSNNTEWWALEMKVELRILITQGQTIVL